MNIRVLNNILQSITELQSSDPGVLNTPDIDINVISEDGICSAVYLTYERKDFKYVSCLEYAPEKLFNHISFDYAKACHKAEIDLMDKSIIHQYCEDTKTLTIDKVKLFDKYFPGAELEDAIVVPHNINIPNNIDRIEDYRYLYIHLNTDEEFMDNRISISIIPYSLERLRRLMV